MHKNRWRHTIGNQLRTREDFQAVGCFSLFVLWLTTFPMAGPLLPAEASFNSFIWPLAVSFFVFAFAGSRIFTALLKPAIVGCSIITLTIAHASEFAQPFLMAMLGLATAPVSIFTGILLRQSDKPLLNAAFGLAIGNLGAILLTHTPLPDEVFLALLAGSISALLLVVRTPDEHLTGTAPPVVRILPFVFCFQLVSGVMYARLLPEFGGVGLPAGVDMLVYALAALVLGLMLQRWSFSAAPLGVLAASTAFIAWAVLSTPTGAIAGTLVMMLAAASIDLFVLSRVLSQTNQLRAYGLGIGVLVLGIAAGSLLAQWLAPFTSDSNITPALLALGALNLSMLTLLPWRRQSSVPTRNSLSTQAAAQDTPPSSPAALIPEALRNKLSSQENQVLHILLTQQTYREISIQMGISESSVKTYAQRIYRKLGVIRRTQLQAQLEHLVSQSLATQDSDKSGSS